MKAKTVKIISAILIALMVIALGTVVFAATTGDFTDPSTIVPKDDTGTAGTMQDIAGNILSIVQVVGVAVAVIMLIVLAIKYISAAPNDKADIKSHAVVYVIGAVCLFAATGIIQLIKTMAGMFN